MNSGKWIVALMGVAAALTLAVNVWFSNTQSPIDQRFNLRRQAIPKDVNVKLLLPEAIGDFKRQSITPVAVDASNKGDMVGSAAYADTDGKQIVVMVRKPAAGQPDLAAVVDDSYRAHTDGALAYAYSEASTPTFIWLNSGWVIRISTTQGTSADLLQLVNLYPF